jgi:hypothetical protein
MSTRTESRTQTRMGRFHREKLNQLSSTQFIRPTINQTEKRIECLPDLVQLKTN